MIGWLELTEDRCAKCDGTTMLPIKQVLFCANCGVIYDKPSKFQIVLGKDAFREEE
jgi:hypothetical protein